MATFLTKAIPALVAATLFPSLAGGQIVPGAAGVDWERQRHEYTAEVLRAYNSVMNEWREAWQNGDLGKTTALYSDQAILMMADSAPFEGRSAIERYLQSVVPRTLEIRIGLSDFVASERLTYALGPFYFEVREAAGTRRITGTAVTVLVREGGRWRIRSQIFRQTHQ